jgi:hypothetical protein
MSLFEWNTISNTEHEAVDLMTDTHDLYNLRIMSFMMLLLIMSSVSGLFPLFLNSMEV